MKETIKQSEWDNPDFVQQVKEETIERYVNTLEKIGRKLGFLELHSHLEELIPWDYIAYGQGIKGSKISYNTVGMSIEIMALGYFKTLSKDKKTWYRDRTTNNNYCCIFRSQKTCF